MLEDSILPRVLIIEDSLEWQKALRFVFLKLGFKKRSSVFDFETALDVIDGDEETRSIGLVSLDWSILSLQEGLSTVTAEDIRNRVVDTRKDITVVIVTGMLEKYVKTIFQRDYWDLIYKETYKEDFDCFKKNPRVEMTGLLKHWEDRRLVEEVIRRKALGSVEQEARRAVPPYRLDWIDSRLIDSTKQSIFIRDHRLHNVLKGMLYKEPGERGAIIGRLSDFEIATIYNDGQRPEDESEARYIAMTFRNNLRRYFRRYGITGSNALIRRIKDFGYEMGADWDTKKPVINQSEPSLLMRRNPDDINQIKEESIEEENHDNS